MATVDGDPLQQLGGFEQELVDEYDNAGSIPFLFAAGPGGRYTVELAYSPSLLEGQSFAALRESVAAGAPTPAAEAIDGEADAITALICRLDGQKPASVCAEGDDRGARAGDRVSGAGAAARIVFRDPFNLALALVAALGSAALLCWAGQVVSRAAFGGLYWDLETSRLIAIGAISIAFGIAVPLQLAAVRQARAAARLRAGAGFALASLSGIAAVSCCSPLILPTILGFLGATGTTVLDANLAAHRWFLPLSAASVALLLFSSALALRDLGRACAVSPSAGGARVIVRP